MRVELSGFWTIDVTAYVDGVEIEALIDSFSGKKGLPGEYFYFERHNGRLRLAPAFGDFEVAYPSDCDEVLRAIVEKLRESLTSLDGVGDGCFLSSEGTFFLTMFSDVPHRMALVPFSGDNRVAVVCDSAEYPYSVIKTVGAVSVSGERVRCYTVFGVRMLDDGRSPLAWSAKVCAENGNAAMRAALTMEVDEYEGDMYSDVFVVGVVSGWHDEVGVRCFGSNSVITEALRGDVVMLTRTSEYYDDRDAGDTPLRSFCGTMNLREGR